MAEPHNPCTVTHQAPPVDPHQNVQIHPPVDSANSMHTTIGGTGTRVVQSPPNAAPISWASPSSSSSGPDVETLAEDAPKEDAPNVFRHSNHGIPTVVEMGRSKVELPPVAVGTPGQVERIEGIVPTTIRHGGPEVVEVPAKGKKQR